MCVPPGVCLFLFPGLGLSGWPSGSVFPIWHVALFSSSEDSEPQGESLRNINKKPQGTSSSCCHLSARFPGNATAELLPQLQPLLHRLIRCPLPERGRGCTGPSGPTVPTPAATVLGFRDLGIPVTPWPSRCQPRLPIARRAPRRGAARRPQPWQRIEGEAARVQGRGPLQRLGGRPRDAFWLLTRCGLDPLTVQTEQVCLPLAPAAPRVPTQAAVCGPVQGSSGRAQVRSLGH